MALDARHRNSIYQKLIPILGEDDANALMTEFPTYEPDELVTRGFLRAEFADLRAEVAALETRLTVRMGAGFVATTAILAALKIFG
jgi:hypothetical protein